MQNKKYLTETEKYEVWKESFRQEMSKLLSELFGKRLGGGSICIYYIDKWNIKFKVQAFYYKDLVRIDSDINLKEIMDIKEVVGEDDTREQCN